MVAQGQPGAVPQKRVDRVVLGLALALLIGLPAFAAFYWFDRHPSAGPSMINREIASAESAVRAQPNDLSARNHLAAAYVSAGRYDDAIAQFSQVLQAAADNRAALLGRALAYQRSSRFDPARADYQALIDSASSAEMAHVDPQLEQAYYGLGVVDLAQDRASDAIVALEAALKIDSGDADALYSYGSALIAAGNPEKGVSALRRAVAFVPTGWCEPYAAMVGGYRALAQADGVAYATGMVAFCDGRAAEAQRTLRGITSGAFSTDAWVGLALIAASQGDNASATAYYRQVLAKDPSNASALIGLGQIGGTDAHASTAPSPSAGP